jgi:hypothetical protein
MEVSGQPTKYEVGFSLPVKGAEIQVARRLMRDKSLELAERRG